MDRRTRTGLNILGAALLLGALGDALLRATPWGLNVLLWAGALLAAFGALQARRRAGAFGGEARWLVAGAAAAAAAFAWRDSPTLRLLDGLALCAALSLLSWRARGRSVRLARLADYARAALGATLDTLFSALPLAARDVRWQTVPRAGLLRQATGVARGLLIAVPLVAVFGALLMAADAVFANLVRDNLHVDAGRALSHALVASALAWCVAGFFRGAIMANDEGDGRQAKAMPADAARPFAAAPGSVPAYTSVTSADDEKERDAHGESRDAPFKSVTEEQPAQRIGATPPVSSGTALHTDGVAPDAVDAAAKSACHDSPAPRASRKFALGAVEVGTVLGLLDMLFASFVLVQIRYFFGGAAHVGATAGLSYAEYARRGFFELVWVAALALPLLLAAHVLLRRDARTVRLFRALAGAQLALLFVIMASAVARMRLYQGEYGLTELRLYTTAFMVWLGLVFVWFAAVVLWRERRERFACGALVSAALVAGALHLLNPDAHIVRANAARARAGRAFDAAYASNLSADAVPDIVAALPALPRDARCALASGLLARWTPHAPTDWRTWNVARSRARGIVQARRAALDAEADCPAPPEAAGYVQATAADAVTTSDPHVTSAPAISAAAILPTPAARAQPTKRATAAGARVSAARAKRPRGGRGKTNDGRR